MYIHAGDADLQPSPILQAVGNDAHVVLALCQLSIIRKELIELELVRRNVGDDDWKLHSEVSGGPLKNRNIRRTVSTRPIIADT